MEVRVSQQVLIVTNILQQYGMEFKLRRSPGDNKEHRRTEPILYACALLLCMLV